MTKPLLILLLAMLTGCESSPLRVEEAAGETQLRAADVQDIALAVDDMERLDPYYALDGSLLRRRVVTGPIWSRGFAGSAADSMFDVTSAELRLSSLPLGVAVLVTYTAEGILTIDGKEYPIKAVGGRSTGARIDTVIREAIELAVVDASRQATKIREQARACAR